MIHFFKELFAYNHHFNGELAAIFNEQADKVSEKSRQWFNHILNAHSIWNGRILQEPTSFGVWHMHEVNKLKEIDSSNYSSSIRILDQFDFGSEINYVTSKGDSYTNTVKDILFHIINHSTYHRGQIAGDFRQQGLEPLVSDYIFYKR